MAASRRLSNTTHSKGGEAFTKLVLETFRLNGRFLVAGDRLTKGIGLTSARWQVLGTLRESDTPLTVAQIARNMGLQRQSVQRTVDVMCREGLLRMVDNPRHRRAHALLGQALREPDRAGGLALARRRRRDRRHQNEPAARGLVVQRAQRDLGLVGSVELEMPGIDSERARDLGDGLHGR